MLERSSVFLILITLVCVVDEIFLLFSFDCWCHGTAITCALFVMWLTTQFYIAVTMSQFPKIRVKRRKKRRKRFDYKQLHLNRKVETCAHVSMFVSLQAAVCMWGMHHSLKEIRNQSEKKNTECSQFFEYCSTMGHYDELILFSFIGKEGSKMCIKHSLKGLI